MAQNSVSNSEEIPEPYSETHIPPAGEEPLERDEGEESDEYEIEEEEEEEAGGFEEDDEEDDEEIDKRRNLTALLVSGGGGGADAEEEDEDADADAEEYEEGPVDEDALESASMTSGLKRAREDDDLEDGVGPVLEDDDGTLSSQSEAKKVKTD